ncbi:MAG: HD domain-containing protein [Paludibacter sp.]|nr:HD domain-containing protein [Paludibacter sp.]
MLDTEKIIEKYYDKRSDIYYILLIHSDKVKEKALKVVQDNPDLRLDTEFIAEAAMLHDIGIFLCDAPRIHCKGTHQYIEHGYLGADLLRKEGLEKHALVCERHTGTGFTIEMIKKQKLPLPLRDMRPQTLEEQVICYADKFYSKTKLNEEHSVEKIRKEMAHYGKEQLATFDHWHKIFSTPLVK